MISLGRTVIEMEAVARLLQSKYEGLRALRRGHIDKQWQRLERAQKAGKVVGGTVVRILSDGLILDIGAPAFLPASELRTPTGDLSRFKGRTFGCQIQRLNAVRGTALVSQKANHCQSLSYARADELEKLVCGKVLRGHVTRDYTVELAPGVEGEVVEPVFCKGELEWEECLPASVDCPVGEEVRVKVLSSDRSLDVLNLELLI